ncbi:MAG: hypothetical protein AB7O68_23460 [Pirellulales bacterium]
MTYHGVAIGLAKRLTGSDRLPNVYVRQTGSDCLRNGANETYQSIREMLTGLGAQLRDEKLTRADLCLDVAGLDAAELQKLAKHGHFVTRAQRVHPFEELVSQTCTGLSVGARPLRLVIYDKLEQQRRKCDDLYFRALVERRWGGSQPEKAARLEFQVSRERLCKCGIDSPADLCRLSGSLVATLMSDWFRLTVEAVDRRNNHQSRAETLPLWQSIAGAFIAVFGQPAGPLVPLDRSRIDPIRLVKQGRGCLANALLQRGVLPTTYHGLVVAAAQLLNEVDGGADQVAYLEDYRRRATEHAA